MTQDREELKRLAEAATPGPWTNVDGLRGEKKAVWVAETAREETERDGVTPSRYGPSRTTICNVLASSYGLPGGGYETLDPWPNAAYIAAANPATVLSLLSDLEAMQALLAKFIAHVEHEEGVSFVSRADPEGYGRDRIKFTAEEYAVLCALEAANEQALSKEPEA